MKRIFIIAALLISLFSFGQSETPNDLTYDTTIAYTGFGAGSLNWKARVSRNANYFTTDTASRVLIITMQGAGEVGTTFINNYGFHFWIANGWDGSVPLGNGIHYPIYITIMPQTANVKPYNTEPLLTKLISEFHPRSVHMGGLSMGVQCLGWALIDSTLNGKNHLMSKINSFVVQEGENPASYGSSYTSTYPDDFGTWALTYNGKMLVIEGNSDARNNWQMSEKMNAAKPGSAFFVYSGFGGGSHGATGTGNDGTATNFWNYFYDRRTVDLTSGNSAITYTYNAATHPHTLGSYKGPPTSIVQWMLRQGDTTLVGQNGNIPFGHIQIGAGEYAMAYLDSFRHWWGLGDIHFIGNGFTGQTGLPYRVVTSPANLTFKAVFGGLHNTAAIDSADGLWITGDNGQGQLGQHNQTVNYTANHVLTDSAGNPFTGIKLFAFYYVKNFSQGWVASKGADTIWVCGSGINGMRGDGSDGQGYDSIMNLPRPIPVPGGRIPKQILGGQRVMILMTDGTIWSLGAANIATDYGFTMTGNMYASLQQIPIPGNPVIAQIAGPMSYNYALDVSGNLFGWGAFGSYMGNWGNPITGGGTILHTPTLLRDSISSYLPASIRYIATNQNATFAILTNGMLYGWGDNAQACLGNGEELDYRNTPAPFAWPFTTGGLLVRHPIRITGFTDWDTLYTGNNFIFNMQAQRHNGNIYAWGRSKGGILGNGFVACSAGQSDVYPNALDIPNPTRENGLLLTTATKISCAICGMPGHGSDTTCGDAGCSVPTITTTVSAGSNQSVSGTTTTLTGTVTTNGVILQKIWGQVSGPNTASFELKTGFSANVSGLLNGTYVFNLKAIDNGYDTVLSNVTVQVGPTTPPTANAGPDQVITLPVNSVILDGTASTAVSPATISNYLWTKASGPGTTTILGNTTATPTVTGLEAGVYFFNLHITDSNGNTSDAAVQVTVNPAPTSQKIQLTYPVKINVKSS